MAEPDANGKRLHHDSDPVALWASQTRVLWSVLPRGWSQVGTHFPDAREPPVPLR